MAIPVMYICVLLLVLLTVHDQQDHVAVATTDSSVLVATLSASGPSSISLNLPVGTPPQKLPLLLDVQSAFTTLRCSNESSSFHPSLSSTFSVSPDLYCKAPMAAGCSCARDTFSLYIERTAFADPLLTANISGVNFTCCGDLGNSSSAGIAGLSKGERSLPAQISKNAGLARQFSYCLPSVAFFGRVTTYAQLNPFVGQMETFTTSLQTRLYYVENGGYAFKLQNMSIAGGGGGVMERAMKMRVSTTQMYTTLERRVYKAYRQSFRKAIGYGTVVKAVKSIGPFDTCFDTSPLYYAGQSPYLKEPTTSMEVEGGGGWVWYPGSTFVYNGSNSLVACMGFLKASAGQPSVLGIFQQLDCLAEFDLQHSRFGFRSIFNPNGFHPETPRCSSLQYPMYN